MGPAEASRDSEKVNIFISYARRDYAIAQILHAQLIELNRDRVTCFLDTLTIESGEGWEKKLQEALLSANWLLCIYTGEQSEYCGYEVGVFTGGKTIDKDNPESSRVVCFHDEKEYPGIFRSHQNCFIQYPPESISVGEKFDREKFYEGSDLMKFFRNISKFQDLYVPSDAEGYQQQTNRSSEMQKHLWRPSASLRKMISSTTLRHSLVLKSSFPVKLGKQLLAFLQALSLRVHTKHFVY